MSARQSLPNQIATARLLLQAPAPADAPVAQLANNWNVIAATASMPFPYRLVDAEAFIAGAADAASPRSYVLADRDHGTIGVIMLKFAAAEAPELGYWLGEPYWGQGYAFEAVSGLLAAVVDAGSIAEIKARVLTHNAASIRVLEKAGFTIVEHTKSVVERHRDQPLVILRWSAA